MHLRHRHRHTAGQSGDHQQRLQRARRNAQVGRWPQSSRRDDRRQSVCGGRRRSTSVSGSIVSRHDDSDEQMRVAPADALDQVLHDRRPDRSRQVVAAGHDRDREAAALFEPVRDVGKQRTERGGTAEKSDQQTLRQRVHEKRRRQRRQHIAERQRERGAGERQADAIAVGQPAHQDAAEAEADHRQRVGERRRRAVDAEFRLHRRQRDDDRPHADTAERGHRQRGDQPPPSGRRVDEGIRRGRHQASERAEANGDVGSIREPARQDAAVKIEVAAVAMETLTGVSRHPIAPRTPAFGNKARSAGNARATFCAQAALSSSRMTCSSRIEVIFSAIAELSPHCGIHRPLPK